MIPSRRVASQAMYINTPFRFLLFAYFTRFDSLSKTQKKWFLPNRN